MSSQATPPSGFVHLILLSRAGEEPFYLEVPIRIITSLCIKPRKYLLYLGWCVLGTIGTLASQEGNETTLDGELEDQGIYKYLVSRNKHNPLAHAVDVEVIKQRSQVPSQATGSRENFRKDLKARDGYCVWSDVSGTGMHIIPFSRGDDWLQKIIDNRPDHEDEDSASITINDIRNGIYADSNLHTNHFVPREVVVLKTPNNILNTTDVPRYVRDKFTDATYPPDGSRYTMQWLIVPPPQYLQRFRNNNDAMFLDHSLPKPADILLHYNYGAAAVKHWGKNAVVLRNRPDLPRPTVPAPAPTGPSRVVHDRNIAIDKRAGANQQGHGAGDGRNTSGKAVDSEEQGSLDEDDVMLFFWGNTTAARERYARKEQERTEYLEKWRAAVT